MGDVKKAQEARRENSKATTRAGIRKTPSNHMLSLPKDHIIEQFGLAPSVFRHISISAIRRYLLFATRYIEGGDKIYALKASFPNYHLKPFKDQYSKADRILSHPVTVSILSHLLTDIKVSWSKDYVKNRAEELLASTEKDEIKARMIELMAKVSGLTKESPDINIGLFRLGEEDWTRLRATGRNTVEIRQGSED